MMSGISESQLIELINMTMQGMPLPPVEDMLNIPCETDWEFESIVQFVKEHYTSEEIMEGMDKQIERLKLIKQIYFKEGK